MAVVLASNARAARFARRITAVAALLGVAVSAFPAAADVVFGVTSSNSLISFDTATPGTLTLNTPITGLQTGEVVRGIDFRPANGLLYALGNTDRLYTLNTTTGAVTQVGAAGQFSLSGNFFGFDFNPVPDRIRITSDSAQNIRINPDTGALAGTDTNLAYIDSHSTTFARVSGSAYSNNIAGATTTTLYDIDYNLGLLAIQNPPNNGSLTAVGSGLGVSSTGNVGFDISPFGNGGANNAFASLTPVGGSGFSNLYNINLATGSAALVGQIGSGLVVTDISIAPAAASTVPLPPAVWAALPLLLLAAFYRLKNRQPAHA